MAPRIALDFTHLDTVSPFAGQYRYVVELVRGLAALSPDADFVLLGSRGAPVPELAGVFSAAGSRWKYRRLEPVVGIAAMYRDHFRYAAVLRREGVRLLHTLHSFVPVFAPCPIVATVYDLMFELFPEYAQAVRSRPYRVWRWSARHRARRLIAISETTASDIARLWRVDRRRIDAISLGSPLAGTAPATPPMRRSRPLIVSPYNLEPRKNLDALLEALARVRHRYAELDVALFGRAAVTPDREASFERRLHELGLEATVRRTGVLSDDDLLQLYRDATIFVFPSLYEGFGLPVLEAMAAGACVVARGASAMSEVMGDAGVAVETTDAAATAAAVTSLLEDPGRRRDLGERARSRAAGFTTARMAEATWRSYCVVLGGAPA